MSKQKLVPILRFSEFESIEGWEKKPFSKLFEIGSGRDYKHLEKGTIPVYGTGGYMLSVNDFLYDGKSACIGRKGTINKPMFLSGKFWTVDTLFYTRSFEECTPEFVYLLFQNINWLKYNEAGGVPSLSKVIINKIEVYIPKPKEQKVIVNFISSLDTVITAETEKLAYLKDHKKGLLQQLFPANGETVPQFRFPEFVGDGDWKETILDDVCKFTKGKGLPKSSIIENGAFPCVHYGQLFTKYTEVIRTIENFTNMENGVLSEKNDVLMPTSDVTPKGLAKASCIKDEKVVLGGDILIIRPDGQKVFGEFLSRYIRHLETEVLKFVSGSTVFHLYASSMKLLELYLPSPKEQQKISNCFSSIDELIQLQTNKIETLKEHKKGLMQQLFPNVNDVAV